MTAVPRRYYYNTLLKTCSVSLFDFDRPAPPLELSNSHFLKLRQTATVLFLLDFVFARTFRIFSKMSCERSRTIQLRAFLSVGALQV